MTELEQDVEHLHYLEREIESRHKEGLLVPSWLYENLHRTEKKVRKEKQKRENNNG